MSEIRLAGDNPTRHLTAAWQTQRKKDLAYLGNIEETPEGNSTSWVLPLPAASDVDGMEITDGMEIAAGLEIDKSFPVAGES